jgi:hypothetical protein
MTLEFLDLALIALAVSAGLFVGVLVAALVTAIWD